MIKILIGFLSIAHGSFTPAIAERILVLPKGVDAVQMER